MLQNKHRVLSLFILSAILLLSRCASQRAPGGGPIDKIPPIIISTFPLPDSTGIKELAVIQITFSESIDESSIANSVFISPPLEFELEWQSDVDLDIHLKDTLKANQTYVIVIGTAVKDLRNNKLAESMQLAISTGDKIDQGKISGKVYDIKKGQTYSMFAYELGSDSILFNHIKPSYISQTGKNGDYHLGYLKFGRYRVFAVNDQNGNLIIDSDFERIGIPYADVRIDSLNHTYNKLNFRTTKIDTTVPKLTAVRPINNRRIDLRLSEQIIIHSIKQIEINDSVTSSPVIILATSPKVGEENTLEVYTSPLDSGRVYLCSIKSISDSSMNIAGDTIQSFIASGFAKMDTFRVVTISPKDSVWDAHPNVNLYFEVNNPLDRQSATQNISLIKQNKDSVKGRFMFPSAYEVEFIPDQLLILDTVYTVKINCPKIKNVWGDTLTARTITRHIKISNGDDYGEIAGKVHDISNSKTKIFVKAEKFGSKNVFFSDSTAKGDSFLLKYLPEGFYKLSAFLDKDNNSEYSPGDLYPFRFSEPFFNKEDTTKVRKRWETSDINLTLPLSN